MKLSSKLRTYLLLVTVTAPLAAVFAVGQNPTNEAPRLKYVVIVSRHGVRSPTATAEKLNPTSSRPWPQWRVPPGDLTEHGAKVMTIFGAYDREFYARKGLFAASGCTDSARLFIYADSDERTRRTGEALANGLFPGCAFTLHGRPEGNPDSIFHIQLDNKRADRQLAMAAVLGRIGGNPNALTDAYTPQLSAMRKVLIGCMLEVPCGEKVAEPLMGISASIAEGKGDHLIEFKGPLATASTLAENILLEYTEGFPLSEVGWGGVDLAKLKELMQLHTAASDVIQRTPYIARAQSAQLMDRVLLSIQQAVEQKTVAGALDPVGSRMLILVGHDTNLSNIAGSLGLSWIIDGRRDDTPPGSALVFELWERSHGNYVVRTYFTAQSLDQMRNATPLSMETPAERVSLFVPGCSDAETECTWEGFRKVVRSDPSSIPAMRKAE